MKRLVESHDGADDRWIPDPRAVWRFYVDVVRTCNLRCPSCPVGNSDYAMPNGYMSPELLEKIVRKAVSETERVRFGLYNWTEPFLHPRLAELIRVVRSHGVPCELSSNFNIIKNIDAVMAANPECLRVSVSGFRQETYGTTHERGDIEVVKQNMAEVARAKQRARATTRLMVPFHRYLGNHEDEASMKEYAESLGFDFEPAWAYLMPMEKALAFADPAATDVTLTDQDRRIIERFALPMAPAIEAARASGQRRCELRDRQMALTHEGKVMLCCATYDQNKYVLASYLDTPLEELQEMKFGHRQCSSCMKAGLHVLYTYASDRFDDLALENVARHHPDARLERMRQPARRGLRGLTQKLARRYRRYARQLHAPSTTAPS